MEQGRGLSSQNGSLPFKTGELEHMPLAPWDSAEATYNTQTIFPPPLNKTLCPNPPPPLHLGHSNHENSTVASCFSFHGFLTEGPPHETQSRLIFYPPAKRLCPTVTEVGLANQSATNVLRQIDTLTPPTYIEFLQ